MAFARWLTSGRHGLVARVLVNRFWLNHFGRGLVNTPGDFGKLGERPVEPELLDWLASEFMERAGNSSRFSDRCCSAPRTARRRATKPRSNSIPTTGSWHDS